MVGLKKGGVMVRIKKGENARKNEVGRLDAKTNIGQKIGKEYYLMCRKEGMEERKEWGST